MNRYSLVKNSFFLFLSLASFTFLFGQEYGLLDTMKDFSYPVSVMESLRYDMIQSLFCLQHDQAISATSFLDQAVEKLYSFDQINEDDVQFLENMLGQIFCYINQLEENETRSALMLLSEQIKNKL